jgi:hypothetical protein
MRKHKYSVAQKEIEDFVIQLWYKHYSQAPTSHKQAKITEANKLVGSLSVGFHAGLERIQHGAV